MGKVTTQTVEIKKSPSSTFGLSRTKIGSARIGDLNVVEHIMLQPSDMARISVDTSILFISPLSVPAFARMKVLTYYFFDAYQNVCDDFNDLIMNYTHEEKYEIANGNLVSKTGYQLPYIYFRDLVRYVTCGLHWNQPQTQSSTFVEPPVGESNSFNDGYQNRMINYPMQYSFCFSSYEQKVDIAKLCNQLDVLPYGFSKPIPKDWQEAFINNLEYPLMNSDSSFTSFDSSLKTLSKQLPFVNYWYSLNHSSASYNTMSDCELLINILPFKVYQHIFNDWFLDTQKNSPIDFYKNTIGLVFSPLFTRTGQMRFSDDDHVLSVNNFNVCLYQNRYNHYMNSIFAIRRPWYSKDYFNTATNDPTLGVSPYAVGTSILDLRKNSALQRLAEKKALCGNKFVDFIVQHFNYYPPSLEIGRSIHLSTSVDYVSVSQVLQTSETSASSPQGERAATASAYGRSHGVFFKAPTYGELFVLQCIKPEIDYYEGIPREMQIVDVADMPLPELSQIGFDSITNSELFLNPFGNTWNVKFGYTPRYSWRKTRLNRIYGELCAPLNYWHQSPSLRFGIPNRYNFGQIGFDVHNQYLALEDISDNKTVVSPAYNRIFAVTDINEDTYVYQHRINLTLKTHLPSNDSPQL